VDGAVDVAFSRKVQHRARPVLGQQALDQRTVADVAVHEMVPCIPLQAGEVFAVARVGEFVQIDDGFVVPTQPVEHEIAADEAGAAGDEDGHGQGPETDRRGV
jgi:hypothetical protein